MSNSYLQMIEVSKVYYKHTLWSKKRTHSRENVFQQHQTSSKTYDKGTVLIVYCYVCETDNTPTMWISLLHFFFI